MKEKKNKKCLICEKELTGKQKKYCSKRCSCRHFYLHNEKKDITEKVCDFCGATFLLKRNGSKYCSFSCYVKKSKEQQKKAKNIKREIKRMKGKECSLCGKNFVFVNESQKYCSAECKSKKRKEYEEKNKEKIKETLKIFYQKNKEEIKKKQKKYAENNKEKIKNYKKQYREENREKIKRCRKKYIEKNREKLRKKDKEYREKVKAKSKKHFKKKKVTEEEKEKRREKSQRYRKKMRKNPTYRLHRSISLSVYKSLKFKGLSKNGRRWESMVGYAVQELKAHLEKLFKPGMTWKNHGKEWAVDHIIPKAFFKFQNVNDTEFKYCWSLDNLQPLWRKENSKKGDKIILRGEEVNARHYSY